MSAVDEAVNELVLEQLPEDQLIARLERSGYIVHRPRPPAEEVTTVPLDELTGKERVRIAVVSCTHFGSKYQQLTALRRFMRYAKKADVWVHAGDLTDGPFKRHKNPHEVFKHDYQAMVEYAAEVLPKGKPWYIIGGNHDRWYQTDGGPDIIRELADRREDVTYLGQDLGYLQLGDALIEVYHMDSGSAYAYSYKLQKHIESLDPRRKPHVSLVGNFHKFCLVHYRNVLGVMLPSFQSQTPWMASRSLVSEVGGVILDIGLSPKGLAPIVKVETVWTYEPMEGDWP